jgi:hypothetical protein
MSAHQQNPPTSKLSPRLRPINPGPGSEHKSGHFQLPSSIRSFIAREQRLFVNAKGNPAAVEDRVDKLRQHDEEEKARVEAAANVNRVAESDAANPSLEAENADKLNKCNFDSDGEEISEWPGRGSWSTGQEQRAKAVEQRAEAAAEEAIDNAADGDSLGWPSQH